MMDDEMYKSDCRPTAAGVLSDVAADKVTQPDSELHTNTHSVTL